MNKIMKLIIAALTGATFTLAIGAFITAGLQKPAACSFCMNWIVMCLGLLVPICVYTYYQEHKEDL
jgi:hypothetical protein